MRAIIAAMAMILMAGGASAQQVVHVYSAQKEHLIRPVLDMFTRASGIEVKLLTGDKAALVTRLEHEGEHTPADVLLTVDIGNIYQAQKKELLQAVSSDTLTRNIPAHLRDKDGHWYGLTTRARAFFMRKEDAKALDYPDLADKAWRGKVLIRSSNNVYNQTLMAFMIHHYGEEKAAAWAKAVVANMARPPQGGDRDQLRALAAGEGDIAVANTYYYGMMVAGDESMIDAHVRDHVVPVFAGHESTGVHINIRGGGVTAHADNKDGALKLLEFLSSEEAQHVFAQANLEYPVNPAVQASEKLATLTGFRADTSPLEAIAQHHATAIRLMDEAGWK